MRSYVGVSVDELEGLLHSESIAIPTLFAPTTEFIATHSDLGEEEHEFILSMLAADESLELREAGQGYVLAVEVPDSMIKEMGADSISIDLPIALEWVACIFLVSPDGEDLTWFAIQEVASMLPSWKK
jgi:chitinase